MANIKSMKKDLRRNERRRLANQSVKSALKTYVKKAKAAEGPAVAAPLVVTAQKALDKAVQRGIIHKKQAARRLSRLMKATNKAAKA